jgi:hypothetical protein
MEGNLDMFTRRLDLRGLLREGEANLQPEVAELNQKSNV